MRIDDFYSIGLKGALLKGHLHMDWDYLDVESRSIINKRKGQNLRPKIYDVDEKILRSIKENYHIIGEYSWEDRAYLEFRKREAKNKSILGKLLSLFLDMIGGYGTKPHRIALWMIITAVTFGIIFFVIVSLDPAGISVVGNASFWDCLYLSGITLLTIGFSNMYPVDLIPRLFVIVEGFLGLFLLSYFTISFTRKVVR